MRPSTLFPLLLATAGAQSCGSACPLHSLAFQDEFSGTAVDEATWNYRTDAKSLSAQLAANVGVRDGVMEIALKKEKHGIYNYTAGGLVSKPNFHYGFYEARIQINQGGGWHNSFWLMAGDGSTTYAPASPNWTEFDTFEIESRHPTQMRNNIFAWRTAPAPQNYADTEITTGVYTAATDVSADYHVFGTLWNETSVSFYTDGVAVAAFDYHAQTWSHDYLNIWVTCIANSNPVNATVLPSKVRTDYVRFYQRDYYLTASSLCRSKFQGDTPCPSNKGYAETGTWAASAVQGYTLALTSRYSCYHAGATASWTQAVPAAGRYDIAAWIVARADSDDAAVYTVAVAGTVVTTVTVDQTSGSARWVTLASSASVAAGHTVQVTVAASGSQCTRSDTVKLVRVS